MGCVSSKETLPAAKKNAPGGKNAPKKKSEYTDLNYDNISAGLSVFLTGGPLTAKDYKERLQSSEGTQTVFLPQSGFTLRYAYVSQRGYYPDAPDKANQDSFCMHTFFGGDPEQVFVGVFDGHGEFGTQCSQFAKDKVPENLANNTHFAVSPEIAFHQAMVQTNNQLHRNDVDDSMSGTTAITCLVRGRTVYVANVGDSRCVLAERHGDRIVAHDLSYDQTPYRRDEAERVKRCGARVLTLDQLEGLKDPTVECWGTEEEDDGDPPRLWAPNATYPGTAFTRSIGDHAAERIGVFAEPEVVTKQLTAQHPFMVLASDGVFEFLPSQSVIDMVAKFEDPQEACFSVVAESYRLWLNHETRTDDITMIVIQFQGVEEEAPQLALPTPIGAPWDYSSRAIPSMHGMALKRMPTARVAAIEAPPHASAHVGATMLGMPQLPGPLPLEGSLHSAHTLMAGAAGASNGAHRAEKEVQWLESATCHSFLLGKLEPEVRRAVYDVMERQAVQTGDMIIQQGEIGDHFFVVEEGQFDVYLQQGMEEAVHVHTYATVPGQPASSFGELALLYGKPRAATVVARTDGIVWSLHRAAYRAVLQRYPGPYSRETPRLHAPTGPPGPSGSVALQVAQPVWMEEVAAVAKTLRGVEVLQPLSVSQLQQMAELMEQCIYQDGDHIIRQGDDGRDFFLITSGEVVCTVRKNPANTEEPTKEVLRLAAGQYFGERALLTNAKRAANVVAAGRVTVLSMSRSQFEEAFGPLQAIIDAQLSWKDRVAMQREVLSRKTTAGGSITSNLSLDDLEARGLLLSTDCSALMLMEHKQSEEIYTVRVFSVSDVSMLAKQALVMRARDITRHVEPSFFVPGVLQAFKDDRVLAEVLMTVGLCTLDMLMTPQPLDEQSAMFVAASIVLGLEHLHWSQVLHRGLSVHTVIVTEAGQVQLVDFRFARRNEGRTYTLCGHPEYLPPEIIEQRGHTEAGDFWALGVLIYCLLSGETPFAGPGDDELRIYRKIVTRTLTFPPHFSPAAVDLIGGLLQLNPQQRHGVGPQGMARLKAHPWFAPMNWDALAEHRYLPPPGIRERIYNFEGVAYAHFDPKPYDGGDITWINNF